ncbi:nicotinate-nucleotide--dimethylbenzimidazole phosphoribosyltransferase [Acidaminobacter sp. JC074]|uniref:nicotinate-nucleotide--dimethylbenzimidazole phosphoribosyltransferase n=1 Tax=Acidaminobacter sp. JC074 TaxID=2530199 RepID=UPI001F116A55|nr:nicotinate-nucleotide--dimethylbenzimidazole phosphoribosyltransferase [Acidaminobacter sp. JC074]MCH4891295.1 nicotinate-nucleotide--dimethylbenzimidazole phosphoribosyltransferase [Acidaminobacter sp. JC074]
MGLLQDTLEKIEHRSKEYEELCQNRVDLLIKPKGSLGKLEDIVVRLAGIQKTIHPKVEKKAVIVCAGDHGIIEEGVATSKKDITKIQAMNMTRGLTGVCALSKHVGAEVIVVDVGIDNEVKEPVINKKVKYGADNFTKGPAMTRQEAIRAIEAGIDVAIKAIESGVQLLATGEMGIGNTTPSSAIVSVIGGFDPSEVTGVGANLPQEKVKHKADVIRKGIELNQPDPSDGIDILSKVGGLEIGGMAGVMIAGAAYGVPVVVDGFICTASALIATLIEPKVKEYLFASHASLELGASKASEMLGLRTYLDMNMRLGEGTGAVLMFNIIEAATYMNDEMITFEEAGFIVD